MRGALATLAALALAACSVQVDGAPCRQPGSTDDCPAGQACGNDGVCSERAASCAASGTRCTPGESRCAGASGTESAETCSGADPACGTWVVADCAARGLVCGTRSQGAVAACECPNTFDGSVVAADPVAGSAADAAPFATGAASPPECRFASLADAVAAAGALPAPAEVRAYGDAGAQVVFVQPPLAIPETVTVVGAAAPAGETVLRGAGPTGGSVVTVRGRLESVRVEGGGATGAGVATACGASGRPSIADVVVDGGGTLTAGVDVSGPCGADLSGVDVFDVAGDALRVHADPTAQVTVVSSAFRASEVGARLTGGEVTFGSDADPLASVEVSGNAGEGVVVTTGVAVEAQLVGARVNGNGGTGVLVELASAGSSVALRGCDVHSNGAVSPRTYGPGVPRTAGGVLVVQATLPFAFAGNRVYANDGDQLAFESSDAGWTIAADACSAASNVFACVDAGAYAVAIAGGAVDARNTVWPALPVQSYASAGVTFVPYCNGQAGVPPTPACPSP